MSALVDDLSDVLDTVTATGRGSRPDSTTPGWRLSCIHRPREESEHVRSPDGRSTRRRSVRMRRVATAVLIALSLAACGTARRPGFPRQWYDEDEQIKQLERVFFTLPR